MDFLLFFLAFFFLSRGGRGNLSMLRKILKPHIKACFIAKLYQTTLFFNKFFKKKKAQVNKHNPPNSNHLRGSKIQGLTPGSLNSLFVLGFSFLPVTQEDRFKSDLPVFTQQVGITGSFTKRRAAHSFAPQFPLSSLPTAAQMDAPAQQKEPNAFPPSQSCREAMAELCWLTPDLHPCSPTGTAGFCARQPFPNPFCCSTGSCQSSLRSRPRLPPSNRVYTLCWICSACHLQRQCLGPAKTPQIQLSPVPPVSALGQGILFQHSSH